MPLPVQPTSREGQVVRCVMVRGIKCLSVCIVTLPQEMISDLHHNHPASLGNGKRSCERRLHQEAATPRSLRPSSAMNLMANKSRSCSDGVSRTPNSSAGDRPHLLAEAALPHRAQGPSGAPGAGFRSRASPSVHFEFRWLSLGPSCLLRWGCSQRWRRVSPERRRRGIRVDVSLLLSRGWKTPKQVDKLVGTVRL